MELAKFAFVFYFLRMCELAQSNNLSIPDITPKHSNTSAVFTRRKRSISCDDSRSPGERLDCGWWGINGDQCRSLGCCYDSTRSGGIPHCYIGYGGIYTHKSVCSFSNPKKRSDCGYWGITKHQCEARDCCYDSRVSGANNCFHHADSPKSGRVIERQDIERLISTEEQVIEGLTTLKGKIEKAYRDYSITKTVGSGVSIGGALATIAGIFFAPATGGLSLGLTVGGITTSLLGGGTTMTASIIETVKTKEWEDELIASAAPFEKEAARIADKIIEWDDWAKLGTSTGMSLVFKGLSAMTVYKMARYLSITNLAYGETPKHLYAIWDDIVTPAFKQSIKYAESTNDIRQMGLTANFLLDKKSVLTKFVHKVKFTTKIGITTLKCFTGVLAGIGIGLDIYTIVDTWVSKPELVTQIDKIVDALENMKRELTSFKYEL